jgi:hypothetical protein
MADCSHLDNPFAAGSVVTFDSAAYARHDSTTLFRFFSSEDTGATRRPLVWSLHDDEPAERILAQFSPVAQAR